MTVRRLASLLVLGIVLGCAAPPAAADDTLPPGVNLDILHQPYGDYLAASTNPSYVAGPPSREDARGIQQHLYGDGWRYNTLFVAQQGLWAFSRYKIRGERRRLRLALRIGRFLLRRQDRRTGAWYADFTHTATPGVVVQPPWQSAMYQSAAICLFIRLGRETGERRWWRAARLALRPYTRSVEDGGVRRRALGGLILFEEYPAPQLNAVLDGFLSSLIGLHDFSSRSRLARRLFKTGVRTLVLALPRYVTRTGFPAYSLAHLATGVPPRRAPDNYVAADITLLSLVHRWTGRRQLTKYRDLWLRAYEITSGTA